MKEMDRAKRKENETKNDGKCYYPTTFSDNVQIIMVKSG